MVRGLAAAALVALLAAPAAAASPGYVEVLAPSGRVVAAGTAASFSYPADGSLVRVGSASATGEGVELHDVSLLGGRVSAAALVLPRGSNAIGLAGVVADGHSIPAVLDTLVPLGSAGYLVVAQHAQTAQGAVGRVGLRLVLGAPAAGLPAGTQILVGLPGAAAPRPTPLAVLGFVAGTAQVPGFVPAPSVSFGPLGSRAVAIAEQFLGVPYRWGGADPLQGFDCSGLTMFVYAQLGIQLTHYTGAQANEGVPVLRGELEPGDLVFFDPSDRGPQHEGIYIGGGRFIHAPHTGDVVKISSLGDPRYGLRYAGAVRPFAP